MSPSAESAPLLEVAVLHARDAAAATAGEADRLLLIADPELGGRSPEFSTLSAVLRETDLPVRVLLRSGDDITGEANPYPPMVSLAESFTKLGADGFCFGFLDRDNEIDHRTCRALANDLGGMPWTFSRAFDSALDLRRAWRDVFDLPGLDAVASGGSMRGMVSGADELLARLRADARVGPLLIASGGLQADVVPWFIRAGVRQFALAEEVRQDGSWTKSHVDATAVRAWRLLVDDAHQHALGVAAD